MPAAPASDAVPGGVHHSTPGDWDLGSLAFRRITRALHGSALGIFAALRAFPRRGRLPGEVPFTALFPGSPLPNPPCEFPRHGLSGDYAVSNAAMCSA